MGHLRGLVDPLRGLLDPFRGLIDSFLRPRRLPLEDDRFYPVGGRRRGAADGRR